MVKAVKKVTRRGRPPLPPGEGRRAVLNASVPVETRQKIEKAAKKNGRSLSKEIEIRLLVSIEAEKREKEITNIARQNCYDAFGGKRQYLVFKHIAACVGDAEELYGADWLKDPKTFRLAKEAILASIESIGPEADAESPRSMLRQFVAGEPSPSEIGKDIAKRRLDAIIKSSKSKKIAKKPE